MEPDLWLPLRDQAQQLAAREPALADALHAQVLDCSSFDDALARCLADVLKAAAPRGLALQAVAASVLARDPAIGQAAQADLAKLARINPACPGLLAGFMSFRGFQALQMYRITHALWQEGREELAVCLQNWAALAWAIDIHPQAQIGREIFLDHGIGIVIGATAEVADGANIWHGVTLGSTLTQAGDRHPKLHRNVTVCAGATILGSITIGEGAVVAAHSVVLHPVDPFTVVAGAPAKKVGDAKRTLAAISA